MGISFGHIYPERYPLQYISEHSMVLPAGEELHISSYGWPKVIYFFSGALEMALATGEVYSINPRETVILYGPQQQRYRTLPGSPATWAHVLLLSFNRPDSLQNPRERVNWDMALSDYIEATFPANSHLDTRRSSALWELAVRLRNTCSSDKFLLSERGSELARLFAHEIAEIGGVHRPEASPQRGQLARLAADMALSDITVTRSEVARRLGTSVATLDRACREHFGLPYASYVDRVKIEEAKSLLLSSSLPIARIGQAVSFHSASSLSRAFRLHTGLTPREYQQSFQGRKTAWSEVRSDKGAAPASRQSIGGPGPLISTPTSFQTTHPGLLFTQQGCLRATVRGVARELDERSILLVAGGESVQVEHPAFFLESRSAWPRQTDQGALTSMASFLRQQGAWLQEGHLLAGVRSHPQQQESTHHRLKRESLLAILWWEAWAQAAGESERAPGKSKGDEPGHRLLVSQAKEYIIKHCAREFTLGEIAWALGVSEEHLARVFRQEEGETVMHFRLRQRIGRAQRQLVLTRHPIAVIAEKAGFISVAHFYKAFKNHVGCTPAAFRKKGVGGLP